VLTPEDMALVEQLFTAWDFDGNGTINLESFGSDVLVGPKKEKVFAQLEKMDVNGDGGIDRGEMELYFGLLKMDTSEATFKEALSEMAHAASKEKDVDTFMRLNAEYNQQGIATDDGTETADEAPELSAERAADVRELYLYFSPDVARPIKIASIAETKVDIGPVKEDALLSSMAHMDLNGDGLLEYGEMVQYFRAVSAEMSDSDLAVVLQGLKDSAAMQGALDMAKGLAL